MDWYFLLYVLIILAINVALVSEVGRVFHLSTVHLSPQWMYSLKGDILKIEIIDTPRFELIELSNDHG